MATPWKWWKLLSFHVFVDSGAALAIWESQQRRRPPVTQQAVERTLGKLLTDEKGLILSTIELEALSRVPRSAFRSLHEDLDERIIRPCLDPDHGEAGRR
jgi:hypothetical protein